MLLYTAHDAHRRSRLTLVQASNDYGGGGGVGFNRPEIGAGMGGPVDFARPRPGAAPGAGVFDLRNAVQVQEPVERTRKLPQALIIGVPFGGTSKYCCGYMF